MDKIELKNQKLAYTSPVVEIVRFDVSDVITTSGLTAEPDGQGMIADWDEGLTPPSTVE